MDRTHIGPVVDATTGIRYPSPRAAMIALGLTQTQRREPRKRLRRIGWVKVVDHVLVKEPLSCH